MVAAGIHRSPYSFAFAIAMTAIATAICWALQNSMPAANLVLVYIAAVIITAVNTQIPPALMSAFTAFLSFNFFFTEPRGTLLMTHREDVLTAALLLLTAILVGSLAARLQGKVRSLEQKDHFARIEQQLLERVSAAMQDQEIHAALEAALEQLFGTPCFVVRVAVGEAPPPMQAPLETYVQRRFAETDESETLVLVPKREFHAMGASAEAIDILYHQYSLALRRVRLLADLAKERIEKERELLRSSLLSSVSHDFRTPLTAMIGATSTLMEMGHVLSAEQQQELLESVLDEAKRLDQYTQNLLDMTRLGQGELQLERSWVSIEEIVNVVMKRIRPLAQQCRVEIHLQTPLPPLRVHAALIEQALFNVLHNAIKFSPPQGLIRLEAHRDSLPVDAPLIIEISDEGPGIPVNERENVFRMFHTAERGDRRVAGSGLGLAICKGMIGAHGGTVSILSAKKKHGCLVRIELPVTTFDEPKGGRHE